MRKLTEFLDIYNEVGDHIGQEKRNIAHAKGLWHKTTHCWILRKPNHILFQLRSKELKDNPNKLYTSASGHVAAGETLKQALKREAKEELGLEINTEPAELIKVWKYTADFVTTDGVEFHDRTFSNIFILEENSPITEYNFQDEELDGLFEMPLAETLEVIKGSINSVNAKGIIKQNNKHIESERTFTIDDFLVIPPENAYTKFGFILEAALKYFNNNK